MSRLTLLFLALFSALVSAAPPTRVAAFGPNGTHWPSAIPTPFLYGPAAHNIEASACTRAALLEAFASVTLQMANEGTRILLPPGALNLGSQSLDNVGFSNSTKRITVCPRDGWGTVFWGGYLNNVRNVCFAGFPGENIVATGCSGSALAWCAITNYLAWYNASDSEFAELVAGQMGTMVPNSFDVVDFYTNGSDITDNFLDGCYIKPNYLHSNWADLYEQHPHTDSFQWARVNGGVETNHHFRDTAIFASNNACIQAGEIDGLIVEHCYMAAGAASRSRYPVPTGASGEDGGYYITGRGLNYQFIDSVFVGGVFAVGNEQSATPFSVVSNSTISYSPVGYHNPVTGAWTVNTGLNASNSGMPPEPDWTRLAIIWANPGTVEPPEEEDPPAVPAGRTPSRTGFFFSRN